MSLSPKRSAVVFLIGGICALALLSGTNDAAAQKGGGGGGGGSNNVAPLQVFDSGGQLVGTLAADFYAGRLIGNFRIFFQVTTNMIVTGGLTVYYKTSDCTGSPYVGPQHALLPVGVGIGTPTSAGAATIIVYPTQPFQLTAVGSSRDVDPEGAASACVVGAGNATVAPAGTLNVTGFTAPFEVR